MLLLSRVVVLVAGRQRDRRMDCTFDFVFGCAVGVLPYQTSLSSWHFQSFVVQPPSALVVRSILPKKRRELLPDQGDDVVANAAVVGVAVAAEEPVAKSGTRVSTIGSTRRTPRKIDDMTTVRSAAYKGLRKFAVVAVVAVVVVVYGLAFRDGEGSGPFPNGDDLTWQF